MALTDQDLQELPEDGGGIDPSNPGKYKTLLEDLQGNIIKGHGRNHSVHLFVQFKPGKQADAKKWIQGFAKQYVHRLWCKQKKPCSKSPCRLLKPSMQKAGAGLI